MNSQPFTQNTSSALPLLERIRAFTVENRRTSWKHVLVTFGLLGVLLLVLILTPNTFPLLIVKVICSILAGLMIVRGFILYHDFLHGAILRGSKGGKALLYTFGTLILTPPNSWRKSHNFHHGHVGQVEGSHIGSFPVMTTENFAAASNWDKVKYRIQRHPVIIGFACLTVFLFNVCLAPVFNDVKRHWDSVISLVACAAVVFSLWYFIDFSTALLAYIIPLWIASAFGAYLFYVQHNIPEIKIFNVQEWTYQKAALESSSFVDMSPVMHWFTGNIGFHHVHHLNPLVPFYRLPEAMAAIPELQHPPTTTLKLKDMYDCLRLKLWDDHDQKFKEFS